jgi:lysozyme
MATSNKIVGGTLAAAIAMSAGTITYFEGVIPYTYADPVGIPTICIGHTGPDVVWGRQASMAECQRLLTADQLSHWRGVERCLQKPVRVHEAAALISFAFNVGVGATCSSTLMRMLNAGAPASQWCQQMDRWVYATKLGVRMVLNGLIKRRAAEREMCLGNVR